MAGSSGAVDCDGPGDLAERRGLRHLVAWGGHRGAGPGRARHGAVYRWIAPEGTLGSAAWGIGGRPDYRDLYLEYQEKDNPRRRVQARVDGLDACRSISATSTLKHLAAEVSFAPERDRLLDLEVRLDWLLIRVRARVVAAESSERLRMSLQVVGRGAVDLRPLRRGRPVAPPATRGGLGWTCPGWPPRGPPSAT